MNNEQQTLLAIQEAIAQLPAQEQKSVAAAAAGIRALVAASPAGLGILALALVGAQIDAQQAHG